MEILIPSPQAHTSVDKVSAVQSKVFAFYLRQLVILFLVTKGRGSLLKRLT
jgi:hypothetical protein